MPICAMCKENPAGETHAYYCRECWCRYQRERYEAKRSPFHRECECGCGELFQVASSRSRRRYLDARHKQLANTLREREQRRAHRRVCETCGGPLPLDARADRLTCSDLCAQRRRHERAKEHRKRWRREKTLSQYGLTADQFDHMLAEQGGRCAICHSDDPGTKGIWHIDHCHAGGHVRGLLCSSCNTGLGQFKDQPEVLRRAADYLEKGTST